MRLLEIGWLSLPLWLVEGTLYVVVANVVGWGLYGLYALAALLF